jgi:hypothetical protein
VVQVLVPLNVSNGIVLGHHFESLDVVDMIAMHHWLFQHGESFLDFALAEPPNWHKSC